MKKIISTALSLVLLLSVICVPAAVSAEGVVLPQGGIIEFGSYPQSEVTDPELLAALNGISAEWVSYEYYYETDFACDSMTYKDVEYGGDRYRAVTFSAYRPVKAGLDAVAGFSYQDDNGYATDAVYWFKYEPLKWRVLDADAGLVLCDSIIDSAPFYRENYSNTRYRGDEDCFANSYKHSDIRSFLAETFYGLAFCADEKAAIIPATVNGNDYTDSCAEGNGDVTDSVFLLSYAEALKEKYGFSLSGSGVDAARRARGTDYAKCQGLQVYATGNCAGNSPWWLRSADDEGALAFLVYAAGNVTDFYGSVSYADFGVRPALYLNPQSFEPCELGLHTAEDITVIRPVACTEDGLSEYVCSECGKRIAYTVPATGHDFHNRVCSLCGINFCGFYQGDADCDGEITAADVSLIRLVFAGNADRKLLLNNCDLNRDGRINAKDLLILRKTLAN